MTESIAQLPPPVRRVPRARMYWRLLWIIPGLAMLGIGLWNHLGTEDNGIVTGIRITTKSGLVGEAAEAVQLIKIGTPDLYLKITEPTHVFTTIIFHHMPVGNGLTWQLSKQLPIRSVQEVEVWDHHSVLSDKIQDRVSLNDEKNQPSVWDADGQTFHIELLGQRIMPPTWALPIAIAGGAITLLVLLRFVWDQAI